MLRQLGEACNATAQSIAIRQDQLWEDLLQLIASQLMGPSALHRRVVLELLAALVDSLGARFRGASGRGGSRAVSRSRSRCSVPEQRRWTLELYRDIYGSRTLAEGPDIVRGSARGGGGGASDIGVFEGKAAPEIRGRPPKSDPRTPLVSGGCLSQTLPPTIGVHSHTRVLRVRTAGSRSAKSCLDSSLSTHACCFCIGLDARV